MQSVYPTVFVVGNIDCGVRRLSRSQGPPRPLWRSPVDPFQQNRQLCRRQRHLALLGRGPDEPPLLQPLQEYAGPLSIPPDDLDQIPPADLGRQTDARRRGPASAPPRPALPRPRSPCACASPRPPARPAYWPGPGSRRKPPDHSRQGFRIIAPADAHPVTASKLDLDVVLCSKRRSGHRGFFDDLDRQKAQTCFV
jgi:hypothetical protein